MSEQLLVDCGYTRSGCQGGWMLTAWNYMNQYLGAGKGKSSFMKNSFLKKKIMFSVESSKPYTGAYSKCSWPSHENRKNLSISYTKIATNIDAIKEALTKYGVLAIGVDASNWKNYAGGIFEQATSLEAVNHAANLVGYGIDEAGVEYWLIKNSWGPSWGENGYIRIQIASQSNSIDYNWILAVTECGASDFSNENLQPGNSTVSDDEDVPIAGAYAYWVD